MSEESNSEDAKAWEGWDVESESSEESDDSGWKDVQSDGDDAFSVSDSDEEKPKKKEEVNENELNEDNLKSGDAIATENRKTSTLATTKV